MRRILALCLILVTISGLAVAEVATEKKYEPKGYIIEVASVEYLAITPLDRSGSVLIARMGSQDQFVIEGVLSKSASKAVKLIAGEASKEKRVEKIVKELVTAREVTIAGDKAIAEMAAKARR